MLHYTYVLLCGLENGKKCFYIGYTNDLSNRVKKHQRKIVTATKKYTDIELVYYEASISKTDAINREKTLKTGFGRAFIKNRIKSFLDKRV